jgi:hypothetical protein
MPNSSRRYDIGYGAPPKETRWKRGQSGNPRGRPPKRADFRDELRAVLAETIKVTIDGEPQAVSIQKGLMLKLRELALKGEVWAQKLLADVEARTPEPVAPWQAELEAYGRELDQQLVAEKVSRLFRNPVAEKEPTDD